MDWDMEIDILIVGAGGCGMAAALAAHEDGVEVGIVEKFEDLIGNTSLSSGSVPGAGTRFQREANIDDSPERYLEDVLRQSGPHEMTELARILTRESAPLVEWLVDHAGVRLQLITDYRHVGHSVPRLHAPASRKGQALLDDLVRTVKAKRIPIAVGNAVERLIHGDNGAVIGAVTRGKRTGESRISAKKIILATNGYAANPDMVKTYCPDIAEAEYFGGHGSTGEAVIWGKELGAQLANMGAYQGYAIVAYPHGSLLSWTTIEKGGIIVDHTGRRFGNELAGYSGFTPHVLAHGLAGEGHPRLAYVIFDARIRDYVASHEEEFRELLELAGVKERASVEDLASSYGLEAPILEETLLAYNAAVRDSRPDEFDRNDFGLAPLETPFVICQVTPGLFHTQGGLKVNEFGMVLRPDGDVIKNLFAGGGAAGGISGHRGAKGYSSGNGLLAALGLGRIAGHTAARQIIERE